MISNSWIPGEFGSQIFASIVPLRSWSVTFRYSLPLFVRAAFRAFTR